MRKKLNIFLVTSMMAGALMSVSSVAAAENIFVATDDSATTVSYKSSTDGFVSNRSSLMTPIYYIFAGEKTVEQANNLIDELGIIDNIQKWAGDVHVISPINGVEYTQDDLDAFIKSVGIAKNVKVIGIEDGATFVNNYVSQNCYFVAGIMVYGGEMKEGLDYNVAVPAYLSNQSESAVAYYKQANGTDSSESLDNYSLEVNTDAPLQRIGVAAGEETLAEAFANAWDSVFSRNYRYNISSTEFYNVPVTGINFAGSIMENIFDPYTLVEIPIFEELGITYNENFGQPVSNMPGAYTWFEYIPETVFTSENESVPLLVTLHGNQNDPRLQGDSTGWVELAAKENFMVVSPEYQDESENSFFGGDGLGDEGVINLVKDLESKYPQIDPSRIYLNGLSKGSSKATLYGIKYSDVFAGVGIVSGVNSLVDHDEIQDLVADYEGNQTPFLYICGDHDYFEMIPVDGSSIHGLTELTDGAKKAWIENTPRDIYPFLQAYQKINGLEVTEKDMSLNEYYGIELDDWHTEMLGDKTMHVGTLSNEKGVMMQLAAVENLAHWNYKPEAAYIWDFLDNYQRNLETGEVIFVAEATSSTSPVVVVGGIAVVAVGATWVVRRRKKA